VSITRIDIWNCDISICSQSAAEGTTGWISASYTVHGCPAHAALVEQHKPSLTSDTRGRGSRERTTWFLTCACGWSGGYSTWSFDPLMERHLAHLNAVVAT
jgi:hypothetical protein